MDYYGSFHDSAGRGKVILQRFVIDVVIEIPNVETKRDRFDEFLPTGRLRLNTATASVTTTPVCATPAISASIASLVSAAAIAVSATVAVSIAISTATAVPIVS